MSDNALMSLKRDSIPYFYAAFNQMCIGKIVEDPSYNGNLDIKIDDLNDAGMELYKNIMTKLENNEYTDVSLVRFDIRRTSMWEIDKKHQHYETYEPNCNGVTKGAICTWRNKIAIVKDYDGDFIRTSMVILYSDDWIYTDSDTLYKLK